MTANPNEGGVYRRNKDGSLTRIDPQAQDLPAPASELSETSKLPKHKKPKSE